MAVCMIVAVPPVFGAEWSALGTGMNNDVYALACDGNGKLYAGAFFTTAGGTSANRIAKWGESSPTPIPSLSHVGMIALALLLLVSAFWTMRFRKIT